MQKVPPMRARCIDSLVELEKWVNPWRLLTQGQPALSPEWALSWWQRCRQDNDELFVILLDDRRGQLIGIAPLYIETGRRQRAIKFLGSGDVCTRHLTVISAPGWEVRAADGLAQFLIDNQDRWDRMCFEGINAEDIAIGRLIGQLQNSGGARVKRREIQVLPGASLSA